MNAKFELQEIEQNVIVQAFAQVGGTDALFERIAQEARSFVPDVTTDKGRKAIGSLAAKVSSSKKLAEKYALDLVAEKKAEVKAVDSDRIQFCKKMDSLRDEILEPRDAWEQAEKDRVAKHKADIEKIQDYAHSSLIHDMASDRIAEQIRMLDVLEICPLFEEFQDQAKLAKFETLESLRKALVAREKYEAEQAELERTRLADLARQQEERDAQIAREATEKANREAEEKARFEAEKAQRDKAESEQREARLVAEKEAAELRATQAAENERKRIEAEQEDKAQAERKAEEARQADVEHRRWINNEALIAFKNNGLDEAIAKQVIAVIAKNQIPHISIKY